MNEQNNGDFSLDDIYFKDCFTQTGNDIDLEVNNATVECITSKNNTFSLDSYGNLIVNSITSNSGNNTLSASDICDLIYPIGSIYLSINNDNPSILFGGTWTSFGIGRCLVGVDASQNEFNTVEKTGGEKNHTLTINEMPQHSHGASTNTTGGHGHNIGIDFDCAAGSSRYGPHLAGVSGAGRTYPTGDSGSHSHTVYIDNNGGNGSHNNLQPYITCYMWKRTA